jgi:hypothetical protein
MKRKGTSQKRENLKPCLEYRCAKKAATLEILLKSSWDLNLQPIEQFHVGTPPVHIYTRSSSRSIFGSQPVSRLALLKSA